VGVSAPSTPKDPGVVQLTVPSRLAARHRQHICKCWMSEHAAVARAHRRGATATKVRLASTFQINISSRHQ
jgi:hypothetical protein